MKLETEVLGVSYEEVNEDTFLNLTNKSDCTVSVEQFESAEHESGNSTNNTLKCQHCQEFCSNNLEQVLQHCRLCPKEAASSKVRKFVCIFCSYTTGETGNMKKHLRIHLGEKCYRCIFCPYSSTHRNALQNHFRNHTGEKPFKCELCSFSAPSLAGISYHRKTNNHYVKKPFKCELCLFSSSSSHNMTEHRKSHTRDTV
uniref:Zinc finger protein 513 n=1 Tax=Cacopsylla melanoneura TaxID=428564 RepID=A0A8D8YVA1_9HEMI